MMDEYPSCWPSLLSFLSKFLISFVQCPHSDLSFWHYIVITFFTWQHQITEGPVRVSELIVLETELTGVNDRVVLNCGLWWTDQDIRYVGESDGPQRRTKHRPAKNDEPTAPPSYDKAASAKEKKSKKTKKAPAAAAAAAARDDEEHHVRLRL